MDYFFLVLVSLSTSVLITASGVAIPDYRVFRNTCIHDVGCFYTGPPFFHPIYRPISLPPSHNLSTQFLLYTPMNPKDSQVLIPTDESLKTSTLDPNLETKILIHGYTTRLDPDDVRFKIKDELLSYNPMNVIIVKWTKDNQSPYPKAVANARAVGSQVAKFINYHVENMNMDPKTVHLIGHSLGAHISGWIGEKVPSLGRITGLDPAGPWFQKAPPEVRLDTTDAEFVDIIHTNGDDILRTNGGFGINEAIGHLDFYPNGGNEQPGCFSAALVLTGGERNENTDKMANSCSHSRASFLFLDSINKCLFVGVQCKHYKDFEEGRCARENSYVALMGYYATKLPLPTEKTSFYLQTTERTPFCGDSDEFV